MTLLNQIEEKILSGMESACSDTFLFTEDESKQIGPEYLLTVNVAKKLTELNTYIGDPYKIYLERKTRLIASDCVPLFSREAADNCCGYRSIVRKRHNTTRNGRADIALYTSSNKGIDTPVCVIELKGFNPNKRDVLQDLKRNAEYFEIACRTGTSQIQYACFAALHSFSFPKPTSVTDEKIAADLSELEQKYKKWQAAVGISKSVDYQIHVKTISKSADISYYPDSINPEYAEEVLENHHHFAGVIVSYKKAPQ